MRLCLLFPLTRKLCRWRLIFSRKVICSFSDWGVISIPVAPSVIVDCWLLTVSQKTEIARIICWPRDSTLRPTIAARIWYDSGAAGIYISPDYKGDNAYFIGHDMSRLYRFLLYGNNNFRSAAVQASHSLLRGPGQAGRTAKQGRIPMLPYLILLVHILVCSNCRRRTPV